jgi:hypothetical protein
MNELGSSCISNRLMLEVALDPLSLNAAQVRLAVALTNCSFVRAGASLVTADLEVQQASSARRRIRCVGSAGCHNQRICGRAANAT